ncbi:MAG: type II toxin-antitoxin system ParD family antitoxin [Variibacter sp.]|nr:type II toxin-antitoxin system ParD family antitoxin [Variibacter sp.]
MSKSTTLELGEYFDKFVDRQVAEGRFKSPEEVVREGLRLVEQQVARLETLQRALIEGEESGAPIPFDLEEFLEEMNADWHVKA